MKKFFILIILLLQILPSYGMLGEGDPIEESRVYTRSLNFQSPGSGTESHITPWVRQHARAVRLVSEWLHRVAGSPTNVALAQITVAAGSGARDFPFSEFITSKTKLVTQGDKKPISSAHIHEFLGREGLREYSTYGLSLVGDYYSYAQREDFKTWLRDILTKGVRLAKNRVDWRLAELDENKLDFFYHSEQRILLSMLRDPHPFWTKIFSGWNPTEPIEVISLSILSYYDPCRRCGDCLLRASEDLLKGSLEAFFRSQGWNPEFLRETVFFIRVAGLEPYGEPLLDGSYSRPLRPRSPSELKDRFADPRWAPLMLIVPRIGCAAEGWLS